MRLAFIGGRGHQLLWRLLTDPSVELERPIAVASDGYDREAAQRRASSIGGALWFDDPLEMLDRYQPDLVNVNAVYGHNGELNAAVIERDIAVVSDKPVAATWDQLARLRELTRNNHRKLLTELGPRGTPEMQAARWAVEQGLLGEVVLAVAQKSYKFGPRPDWFGNRADSSGILLWIGTGAVDSVRFTTGRRFTRVVGLQGNLSHPELPNMEDHAVCMFEMVGGGKAVVHIDYLRPGAALTHGDDRLRLVGTRGQIEVRDDRCWLTTESRSEHEITNQKPARSLHIEALAAARGEKTDLFSTESSLELAQIMLHAQDAADNNRAVDISY